MKEAGNKSIWIEIIKGMFALLGVLVVGYTSLVAAGVLDFPFAKSKIDAKFRISMNELKAGLEELDIAIETCASDELCYVYCRQEHPANVLHGYEIILNAESYDVAGEPKYIKEAYASYQSALKVANSPDMQKIYNACLIFDRTDAADSNITQEEFDTSSENSQADITEALEILNAAIAEMP